MKKEKGTPPGTRGGKRPLRSKYGTCPIETPIGHKRPRCTGFKCQWWVAYTLVDVPLLGSGIEAEDTLVEGCAITIIAKNLIGGR